MSVDHGSGITRNLIRLGIASILYASGSAILSTYASAILSTNASAFLCASAFLGDRAAVPRLQLAP